ncbi:MAG: hypothetical protein HQL28_03680 [Candidatus Omnitrophica bacterium]|nr:hypothetical protein [Candidatus Omnitrophota bacterium]
MANKTLVCTLCNGEMELYVGPKFNRKVGGALVAAGAFSTLFWVGAVLGVPLMVAGAYMAGAKRELWVCKDCNTAIERVVVKPKSRSFKKVQ